MTTTFELFTCNYPAFQEAMGTPVQASNGKPRWPLKYDLRYAAKEVYPPWGIVRDKDITQADFATAYAAHLDTIGVEKIAARLRGIAVAEGESRLVLLCYEDISKPDWWCHRTMFATWWTAATGDDVRELGPRPSTPPPTLF